MWRVYTEGGVNGAGSYTGKDMGVRPLIKLPTGTKMSWNETNQNWDIDPNQLTGAITAQNYGDKVHYEDPAGVWQEEGNGWTLFLEENGSKYLISNNYVKRQFLNLDSNLVIPGDGDIGVAGKTKEGLEIWLKTSDYWNHLSDLNLVSDVKGGTSVGKFWTSYNEKYKTNHAGMEAKCEFIDTLYFPEVYDGCTGWWLADDPSGLSDNYYPRANFQGEVASSPCNKSNRGVRPLVQLRPETKMRWDGKQWILYKENTN